MPEPVQLRRAVLAVSVLWDVDVLPDEHGVALPAGSAAQREVHVPWQECEQALHGADPEGGGRARLAWWLRTRRRAGDLSAAELASRLRPLGLPVGHELHPGPGWCRTRVLGGALELGPGVLGLDPAEPDVVAPVPTEALTEAGLVPSRLWPRALAALEELGGVAADLLGRDARGLLRPVGGADVVTLLGARSLRTALAARSGGMATAVVPMRTRGWTRLSLVDPAFGPAAAAATAPADRGFARPLLITADEVALAASSRPDPLALRQPAAPDPAWGRSVQRG